MCTELQTVTLQYWRPSDFSVGQQISHHRNNPVHSGTEEQQNGLKNQSRVVSIINFQIKHTSCDRRFGFFQPYKWLIEEIPSINIFKCRKRDNKPS